MIKTILYSISDLASYINWEYFFFAWQMPPKFASLAHMNNCVHCQMQWLGQFSEAEADKAREGKKLYADALEMLESFNSKYHTYGRIGLFRTVADDDDLWIYRSDDDLNPTCLPMLRQQHATLQPNLCLADFIQPKDSGRKDTLGVFATTVDQAMEDSFADDPYRHLLAQTLCDRLAEATSELLHFQVRTDLWGYAPDEHLTPAEMFQVKYQGIRPAVGYPSLPDQSINFLLHQLIDFSSIGIRLTETGAMLPHGSVSGLMLAHPKAVYFAVGKIGEDQLNDYARRRNLSREVVRKFLTANL